MNHDNRAALLLATAAIAVGMGSTPVVAQVAPQSDGLADIIVTAQKREQSLQDVPVAVTALSGETLTANRITSVTDLTGLAPGVTVRSSAGGSSIPSFTIRGSVSYGVVPGSDRQVSTYLDGVYLSAPRGATFDLPDVQRIEVLRGPQGTLFGRNATAGAVSVSTRDPEGKVGVTGRFTVGNRDQYRFHLGVDTPQIGPLSAYFSVLHDYRRGDIRNAGAGQIWDRTSSPDPLARSVQRSPRWLGTKNVNAYFAAVKFETGDFVTTYKFDSTKSAGTPEGVALNGISDGNDALSRFLRTLVATQPTPVNIAADGKRPDVVNNGFAIRVNQKNFGHNLTSTMRVSDSITLKNVFGYRQSRIFSASPIDGMSSLTLTAAAAPLLGLPASLVGSPFVGFGTAALVRNKQWSEEFQLNYNSDFLTLTAGALWFKSIDRSGTNHVPTTVGFTPYPGGVIGVTNFTDTLNRAQSTAAYLQAEVHVTPQIDIVGGARVTHDKKSGRFIIKTATDFVTPSFTYKKTRPSWLIGVNYKPVDDILLYGKYSTAFVSGGSIAGYGFAPETAASWEAGIKTELLDRRLRANLALFAVTYKNLQTSQSATLVPDVPDYVGTFILSQGGPVKARGFEAEVTAAPVRGVTIGGSLSYTKTKATDVNPLILAASGGSYSMSFRPKWTSGAWAQLRTQPLIGDAYLSLRGDANWQSSMLIDSNPTRTLTWAPNFPKVDPYWLVNARLALTDIKVGGLESEVALWGKNLTDTRSAIYGLNLNNALAASSFLTARTYGVDLMVRF